MKLVERVTVHCTHCQAPIIKRVTDVEKSKTGRFFCSPDCLRIVGAKPRRRANKVCEQCATIFYPTASAQQRYCSSKCVQDSQRHSDAGKLCPICSKPIVVKSRQRKFCSRECYQKNRWSGSNVLWDRVYNGRPAIIDGGGYVRIFLPEHPKAFKNGQYLEHRHVVEKALGRYLEADEHVHHINHVRTDNRLENLVLMSQSEHARITGYENGVALTEAINARQKLQEALEKLDLYEKKFGIIE